MTPSLTMHDSAEPTFLRFGTWSVFLHLGLLTILSLMQTAHVIEEQPPVVQVTLIQTPVIQPAQEEAYAEAPPLMTSRRHRASTQPAIPPPLAPASIPSTPMTLAHVAPPPPTPNTTPPVERRVLHDRHATDALKLKGYLKTAQRTTMQPATSTSVPPPSGMPTFPSIITTSIPSPATVQPSLRQPTIPRSDLSAVLTATPSGTDGILKSKVGLDKPILPVFPLIAKESGWGGVVVIRVSVEADGTPRNIRVRKSSGHQVLDDAAIEAVKHHRFIPARDGNIPVRKTVDIPINFDLRNQG